MSTLSTTQTLIDLHDQFLTAAAPDSVVAVVTCSVDPDHLMTEYGAFWEHLSTLSADPPLVLLPRKFDAQWLAHRYADHTNVSLAEDVFLGAKKSVSRASGEMDLVPRSRKITIVDHDHVLRHAELLRRSSTIVLCNVQDHSLERTAIQMILDDRLGRGAPLFLVIFTPPVPAESAKADQTAYAGKFWNELGSPSKVLTYDDTEQDRSHLVSAIPEHVEFTIDDGPALLTFLQRCVQGMAICVADELVARRIERELNRAILTGSCAATVEIVVLHRHAAMEVISQALLPPGEGMVRVLISVGVLESAQITVPWINLVVSDGLQSRPGRMTMAGSVESIVAHASYQHLDQQAHIVGEHPLAVPFVRLSTKPVHGRPKTNFSDTRFPAPAALVLRLLGCGLDVTTGAARDRFHEARRLLLRLNLVTEIPSEDAEGVSTLSDQASAITRFLPLGIYAKSVLMTAIKLNILDVVLPMVAVMEVGGVRRVLNTPHDYDREADIFDTTIAFVKGLDPTLTVQNISSFRVQQAHRILTKLQQRCKTPAQFKPYLDGLPAGDLRQKLKACLFAGASAVFYLSNADPLHPWQEAYAGDHRWSDYDLKSLITHQLNAHSTLPKTYTASARPVITGKIRMMKIKSEIQSVSTIEWATLYTPDDLMFIHGVFPELIGMVADKTKGHLVYGTTWLVSVPRTVETSGSTTSDDITLVCLDEAGQELPHIEIDQRVFEHAGSASSRTRSPVGAQGKPQAVARTPTSKSKKTLPDQGGVESMMSVMASQLASAWGAQVTKRRD